MGEVYQATDLKLGRNVAVKFLSAAFAARRGTRVALSGAQVLASLNRSNIAQVCGIEESSGSTCIAMELIKGEPLQAVIALDPAPVDEALPIAITPGGA